MAKKLYKSDNRFLAGVCGGLAEFFNMDATVMRVIVILLTCFTGGAVIIAYIIAAIIMPAKPINDFENLRSANEEFREERKTSGKKQSETSDSFDSYFSKDKK